MKNLIVIFSLFVVSLSYGTNPLDCKKTNQVIDLCEKVESNSLKTDKNKVLGCSSSVTSTVTTNADGSTTRTTTTTVSCDTAQELAQFHKLMLALGIGL